MCVYCVFVEGGRCHFIVMSFNSPFVYFQTEQENLKLNSSENPTTTTNSFIATDILTINGNQATTERVETTCLECLSNSDLQVDDPATKDIENSSENFEFEESDKSFGSEWPLVSHSNVIVNFANISWDKIENGDFYLYVKKVECPVADIGLWVKFCVGYVQSEVEIPVSKFGNVFTMEFKEDILLDKTDMLGDSLHHCLTGLEDSINKLRWQDVVPRTGQFNHVSCHLRQPTIRTNGLNGSCAEKVKQFKNQQNNCVKCEKLTDNLTNNNNNNRNFEKPLHAGVGYYSKENRKSNQSSPGKLR